MVEFRCEKWNVQQHVENYIQFHAPVVSRDSTNKLSDLQNMFNVEVTVNVSKTKT